MNCRNSVLIQLLIVPVSFCDALLDFLIIHIVFHLQIIFHYFKAFFLHLCNVIMLNIKVKQTLFSLLLERLEIVFKHNEFETMYGIRALCILV